MFAEGDECPGPLAVWWGSLPWLRVGGALCPAAPYLWSSSTRALREGRHTLLVSGGRVFLEVSPPHQATVVGGRIPSPCDVGTWESTLL